MICKEIVTGFGQSRVLIRMSCVLVADWVSTKVYRTVAIYGTGAVEGRLQVEEHGSVDTYRRQRERQNWWDLLSAHIKQLMS